MFLRRQFTTNRNIIDNKLNNKLKKLLCKSRRLWCVMGYKKVKLTDKNLTDKINLKDKNTMYDYNIQKYTIKLAKRDKSDKSIESIVLDYNRRWKQNITIKDFKDNFYN